MTTCAENSSFGLFFKTFDQQDGPSEICMHVIYTYELVITSHANPNTVCCVQIYR